MEALLRVGDADHAHQLERAVTRATSAVAEPDERSFADLLADAHHRIERGHRLLEDHRDRAAPQIPPRVLVDPQHVDALELNHACDRAVVE